MLEKNVSENQVKGMEEGYLLKIMTEIKGGIKNVLAKGDAGKSGATATSFERVQEKASDELIKRLRDIKDQITSVMIYNKNFELHMNEEMKLTLTTLDARIESSLSLQQHTADHLKQLDEESSTQRVTHHEGLQELIQKTLWCIQENQIQSITSEEAILSAQDRSYEVENRLVEMVGKLDARIGEVESSLGLRVDTVARAVEQACTESRQRDENILKLLEKISKKQSMETPSRPLPERAPTPPSSRSRRASPNPNIGSVGLMLGQLTEAGTSGGQPKIHLQVQGVLPGGSAEMSGMFRAGDEVMKIDGLSLDGKTLLEAKRLFLGLEGSMVQLSVWRPSTGKEFTLSLRRHVFTNDGNTDT